MTEMLNFFITSLGDFFGWLGTLVVANGVSLLGLFGAFFVIYMLLSNFLLRAR